MFSVNKFNLGRRVFFGPLGVVKVLSNDNWESSGCESESQYSEVRPNNK